MLSKPIKATSLWISFCDSATILRVGLAFIAVAKFPHAADLHG
jgi:hypothetical protein